MPQHLAANLRSNQHSDAELGEDEDEKAPAGDIHARKTQESDKRSHARPGHCGEDADTDRERSGTLAVDMGTGGDSSRTSDCIERDIDGGDAYNKQHCERQLANVEQIHLLNSTDSKRPLRTALQ